MQQEAKVLRTKQISLDVLAVHDGSQCGFLKMLFQPLKVIVLVVFIITMMMICLPRLYLEGKGRCCSV